MNGISNAGQAKLWEIIRDIPVALMTTDDDGVMRSRPMAASQKVFDGFLWFFTKASSHKKSELEKNYRVNVSYADPRKNGYVSISGLTQLIRDPAKKRELWNDSVASWMPDGLDDEDVALLKVEVQQAEYWQGPTGQPGKAAPGDHGAEQHGKLSFD